MMVEKRKMLVVLSHCVDGEMMMKLKERKMEVISAKVAMAGRALVAM